jgi:hypothetical protein
VLQVELVRLEQEHILRCLVKHHGLRRVLAEGVTPTTREKLDAVLAALRETDQQIAALLKNHADVRGKSAEVDNGVDDLVRDHRTRLLEFGAVGELAMNKELEVVPLDDDALHAAENPVRPDGMVKRDPEKRRARNDGHVQAALASGPVSLLIQGSHNLTPNVQKLGSGSVEYLRVTTKRYSEFAFE